MAHWSIAYCIGPNYNKPWETFEDDEKPACIALARTSIQAARGLLDHVTPLEHTLIDALAAHYPETSDIDDFSPWNDAFTDAIRWKLMITCPMMNLGAGCSQHAMHWVRFC